MKIYNSQIQIDDLSRQFFSELLISVRNERNFRVQHWVEKKSEILNSYLKRFGLTGCVVAVSGGIDSAVVLSLVNYASKQKGSNIKKIVPICLPAFSSSGVTGQQSATDRGLELIEKLNLDKNVLDITGFSEDICQAVNNVAQFKGFDWSKGQLVPYVRTPILYYLTAVLSEKGFPSVICGTTNRDEGAYLGYVGKASDGMVDLQLISDLHKSEVYQVAKFLGVPASIINEKPTGDMYDGRVDEEVFGVSYDFVELFLHFKNSDFPECSENVKNIWNEVCSKLEGMHKYNKHKYLGKSPAVHLDIYDSGVKGGWDDYFWKHGQFVDFSKMNGFVPKKLNVNTIDVKFYNEHEVRNSVVKSFKLLDDEEVDKIVEFYRSNENLAVRVGIDGYKGNKTQTGGFGSRRLTIYDEIFANKIFKSLRNVQSITVNGGDNQTDWHEGGIWRFSGVNPVLRFINYDINSELVPHYDYSHHFNEKTRTLYSLVIYLTDGEKTVFYENYDPDLKDIIDNRNLKEVFSYSGKKGCTLLFPHHLLHSGPKVSSEKLIIRTDLIHDNLEW